MKCGGKPEPGAATRNQTTSTPPSQRPVSVRERRKTVGIPNLRPEQRIWA